MRARPTSADDTDDVLILLGPHDEHEALFEWSDGDEPLLEVGVRVIVELEIICSRCEEPLCLLEGNAVLSSVREVLVLIPSDLH